MGKQTPVSLEDLKGDQSLSSETQQEQSQETVQQTEQTQEVVQETSQEQTQQEVQETVSEETSQEQTQENSQENVESTEQEQIQKSGFAFEFLSTLTGTTFESEDQVKEAFNKPTMESEYGELKTQHDELNTQHTDLNEKYNLLTEQLDPSQYFGSDDAMKLAIFEKDNPNKDASIAQKVFSTEDLSTVGDLEMVKMGMKFQTRNLKGTEADLEATIAEEMGQESDTPFNEWPVSAQNRLAIKASEYRDQFDTVKKSVTLPEKFNIEELHTQRREAAEGAEAKLTTDWSGNAEKVLNDFDKLKVPVGEPKEGEDQQFFEWDLGEVPKSEVDELTQAYISNGLEMTDDSQKSFNKALELSLLDKNLSKMMQAYGKDLLARQEETHLKETNNTEALTDSQRPVEGGEDKVLKERSTFARTGGSSILTKPLFKTKT